MTAAQEHPPQRVSLTFGFLAFLGVLALPFLVAIGVYVGAWIVSGDVYAAQASPGTVGAADWQHALVGICPLH